MLKSLFLAGFGGFIGTCIRFLVNKLFPNYFSGAFPWPTFIVNILGCFIFGIILGWLNKTGNIESKIYPLLITGFCGGLTTFSTFSNELFTLSFQREWIIFGLYLFLSIFFGILLAWLGKLLMQ